MTKIKLAVGVLGVFAFAGLAQAQGPGMNYGPAPTPGLSQSLPQAVQPQPLTKFAPYLQQSLPHNPPPVEVEVVAPPASTNDPLFWVTGDYLFSWMGATQLPLLATTSPAGTPQVQAGVAGQGNTTPLFDQSINNMHRNGFRVGLGGWFAGLRRYGAELGFSMLEGQNTTYFASSDQYAIIGRPFFNLDTGRNNANLVAFPGFTRGNLRISATSGNLLNGNADILERVIDTGRFKLNVLMGYRFYQHVDTLLMQQNIFPQGAAFVAGTTLSSYDLFDVRNTFHGGEAGFKAEINGSRLTWDFLAKLAYGRTQSIVRIEGSQVTQVPGDTTVTDTGGVYALASNIGTRTNYNATILPEFGTNLRWRVFETIHLQVGYTILMIQGGRASDQVDTFINQSNFPPAGPVRTHPAYEFKQTNIWVQSINVGFTLMY